jgi:hypothetical protein
VTYRNLRRPLPIMLWELSGTEQRYRAVLEARAGVPETEVAERYRASRHRLWTISAGRIVAAAPGQPRAASQPVSVVSPDPYRNVGGFQGLVYGTCQVISD